MKRTRLLPLILGAFLSVVTGCLLDSDEETYGIDGHVRDDAGNAVADVLIRKTGSESGSTYTRSNGYYWIPVDRQADDVALIALRTGWVFCPGRRDFTDLSVRHHNQDFTGFYAGEIVIDGFIHNSAGEPVEGVKVVNQEPGIMNGLTSVTNYLGYYRFSNVLAGFRYRMVPSKPGCAFSPSERVYTLPSRDYLRQDFAVSCAETFGIQGYVRDFYGNAVSGVTLTMMPDGVTAVTDEDGFFTRDGLSTSAAVEVIPSKSGCVFSPDSKSVYAAATDVRDVDFTVHCGEVYSVSGQVLLDGAAPLPDIALTITGGCCPPARIARTDEEGRYEFAGLRDGFDYIIKPEFQAWAVAPESIVIERLDRDHVGQDFAASSEMVEFRVTGCVRDSDGAPLVGEVVEFGYYFGRVGENDNPAGDMLDIPLLPAITDEEGLFSIPLPRTYTVMLYIEKTDCYFIPFARWCRGDRDHEDQDFVAHCGGGATISGYVRDVHGEPVPNVRVDVSGEGYYDSPFAHTDTAGYYELANLPNGLELTVRAKADYSIPYEGCIFCPAGRVYSDVTEDLEDQNFTMSCPWP
jgi:hypothetical protein